MASNRRTNPASNESMYLTIEELSTVLCVNRGSTVFMEKGSIEQLAKIIPNLRKIRQRSILFHLFKLQDSPLPLELLYILHEEGVLLLTTYLYIRQNEVEEEIVSGLTYLTSQKAVENESRLKPILQSIVGVLCTVQCQTSSEVFSIANRILDKFLYKICEALVDQSVFVREYLKDLDNLQRMYPTRILKLFLRQMSALLCYNSEFTTAESTYSVQLKECVISTTTTYLANFYSTIFASVGEEKAFSEIAQTIADNRFNWRSTLVAISVYCRTFGCNAANNLKVFIDTILRKAFSEQSRTALSIALLLARQCCAEEIHHFSSYADWFGSLKLKNQQECKMLYGFLESIIPYEAPIFMKIQINKVPLIPPKCQAIVSSYCSVVKTRLSELNETTEYLGLFNECHLLQNDNNSDLQKVLEHFKQTKSVMSTVLEASIFRKQYYTKVFLPQLLTDGNSISTEELEIRIQFIEKLQAMGKISKNMYNKWKQDVQTPG